MKAFCKTCESLQDVEPCDEEGSGNVYCLSCGEEFPLSEEKGESSTSTGGKYENYKIGIIVKVEPVPKSKDLKLCSVDVSGDGNEERLLKIVTNAKYCEAGWRVVVACIGAVVPAGAVVDEDGEAIQVTKRAVQGVLSEGMICDCEMLRWTGGAKGFIQQLPESFKIGDPIPDTRPRI